MSACGVRLRNRHPLKRKQARALLDDPLLRALDGLRLRAERAFRGYYLNAVLTAVWWVVSFQLSVVSARFDLFLA